MLIQITGSENHRLIFTDIPLSPKEIYLEIINIKGERIFFSRISTEDLRRLAKTL